MEIIMTQERLDRLNALARKSRTEEGLTPAEKEEQTALRNEYRAGVIGNLSAQLDNVVIVEPDGTKRKVQKKED